MFISTWIIIGITILLILSSIYGGKRKEQRPLTKKEEHGEWCRSFMETYDYDGTGDDDV